MSESQIDDSINESQDQGVAEEILKRVQVFIRVRPEAEDQKMNLESSFANSKTTDCFGSPELPSTTPKRRSTIAQGTTPKSFYLPTKTLGPASKMKSPNKGDVASPPPLLSPSKPPCIEVIDDKTIKMLKPPGPTRETDKIFRFNKVFGGNSTQEDIYDSVSSVVRDAVQGLATNIFAYGSARSGKTHTMLGNVNDWGIIPRAIQEVFQEIDMIHASNPDDYFFVELSYVELYNNGFKNLLKNFIMQEMKNSDAVRVLDGSELDDALETMSNVPVAKASPAIQATDKIDVHESQNLGVFLAGSKHLRVQVKNAQEAMKYFMAGSKCRTSRGSTYGSSRSHAIFTLHIENRIFSANAEEVQEKELRLGKLSLVDMAGSDRLALSGAKGDSLVEAQNINVSLTALGDVLSSLYKAHKQRRIQEKKDRDSGAISIKKADHVPYLNNKLTHYLKEALGGNCRTIMITTIHPSQEFQRVTETTLQYAAWAMFIDGVASINRLPIGGAWAKESDPEILQLRKELEERSKVVEQQRQVERTGSSVSCISTIAIVPLNTPTALSAALCDGCYKMQMENESFLNQLVDTENKLSTCRAELQQVRVQQEYIEQQNGQLAQENHMLQEEVDGLREANRDYSQQIDDLEVAIGGKTEELAVSQDDNGKLRQQVSDLEAKVEVLEEELQAKTQALEEAQAEHDLLRSQLSDNGRAMEDQLHAKIAELEKEREMNQQLTAKVEELQVCVDKRDDQISTLVAANAELSEKLKELTHDSSSLEGMFREKSEQLEQEKATSEALRNQIQQMMDNGSNDQNAWNQRMAGMQSELQKESDRIKELLKENDALRAQLQEAMSSSDDMKKQFAAQVQQLQEEKEALQQHLKDTEGEYQGQLKELAAAREELSNALFSKDQDGELGRKHIKDLDDKLEEATAKIHELHNELTNAKCENEHKDSVISALRTEIDQLKKRIEELEQENAKLHNELRTKELLIVELTTEVTIIRSTISEREQRIAVLEKQVETVTVTVHELQSKIVVIQHEQGSLSEEFNAVSLELKQSEDARDELQADCDKLAAQLRDTKEKLVDAEKRLVSQEKDYEVRIAQLQSMLQNANDMLQLREAELDSTKSHRDSIHSSSQQQHQVFNQQLHDLRVLLEEMRTKLHVSESDLKAETSKNGSLMQQISTIEQEKQQLHLEMTAAKAKLQSQVDELSRQLTEISTQHSYLSAHSNDLKSAADSNSALIAQLHGTIETLRQQLQAKSLELTQMKEVTLQLEHSVLEKDHQLRAKDDALAKAIADAAEERNNIQEKMLAEIHQIKVAMKELIEQLRGKSKELEDTKRLNSEVTAALQKAKDELNATKLENELLKQQLDDLRRDKSLGDSETRTKLAELREQHRQQVTELTRKVAELQEEYKRLQKKLNHKETELSMVIEQYNLLRIQLTDFSNAKLLEIFKSHRNMAELHQSLTTNKALLNQALEKGKLLKRLYGAEEDSGDEQQHEEAATAADKNPESHHEMMHESKGDAATVVSYSNSSSSTMQSSAYSAASASTSSASSSSSSSTGAAVDFAAVLKIVEEVRSLLSITNEISLEMQHEMHLDSLHSLRSSEECDAWGSEWNDAYHALEKQLHSAIEIAAGIANSSSVTSQLMTLLPLAKIKIQVVQHLESKINDAMIGLTVKHADPADAASDSSSSSAEAATVITALNAELATLTAKINELTSQLADSPSVSGKSKKAKKQRSIASDLKSQLDILLSQREHLQENIGKKQQELDQLQAAKQSATAAAPSASEPEHKHFDVDAMSAQFDAEKASFDHVPELIASVNKELAALKEQQEQTIRLQQQQHQQKSLSAFSSMTSTTSSITQQTVTTRKEVRINNSSNQSISSSLASSTTASPATTAGGNGELPPAMHENLLKLWKRMRLQDIELAKIIARLRQGVDSESSKERLASSDSAAESELKEYSKLTSHSIWQFMGDLWKLANKVSGDINTVKSLTFQRNDDGEKALRRVQELSSEMGRIRSLTQQQNDKILGILTSLDHQWKKSPLKLRPGHGESLLILLAEQNQELLSDIEVGIANQLAERETADRTITELKLFLANNKNILASMVDKGASQDSFTALTEINKLKDRIAELETTIANLKLQKRELSKNISELNADRYELQSSVDRLMSEMTEVKQEKETALLTASHLDAQVVKLTEENMEIHLQLSAKEEELLSLQQQLATRTQGVVVN